MDLTGLGKISAALQTARKSQGDSKEILYSGIAVSGSSNLLVGHPSTSKQKMHIRSDVYMNVGRREGNNRGQPVPASKDRWEGEGTGV